LTEASLIFSFSSEQASSLGYGYSIELDNDYFEVINEEERTTFLINDTVYLKIYPCFDLDNYELTSSYGSLSIATKNIIYEEEEDISFAATDEGSLSYFPYSITSYEWIGNDCGTPTFSDRNISVPSKSTGILRVVYEVKGDRLKLSNADLSGYDDGYSVLCVAEHDSGEISSLSVNFEGSDTDQVITDVNMIIKDVITEEPIPDASIVVTKSGDTIFTGNANESGEILIPDLVRGETYNIITTAVGYFSSAEDYLNNDYFTVPTED
jgi:hypothetical protein